MTRRRNGERGLSKTRVACTSAILPVTNFEFSPIELAASRLFSAAESMSLTCSMLSLPLQVAVHHSAELDRTLA